jgi:hypothetical protein
MFSVAIGLNEKVYVGITDSRFVNILEKSSIIAIALCCSDSILNVSFFSLQQSFFIFLPPQAHGFANSPKSDTDEIF